MGDIIPQHIGHLVTQYDTVLGPAFMHPSNFLSYSRQEALRVEESHHPEHIWTSGEEPCGPLLVPLQKLFEPEAGVEDSQDTCAQTMVSALIGTI